MKTRKRGGSLALKYFGAENPKDVAAGSDLLGSYGNQIRPKIGGKCKKRIYKKTKGGFIPSIMDGFLIAASKYIVPLSLFSGYKLMTKKSKSK